MTTVSRDRNAALGHDRGHEAIRGTRGLLHDLGHQLMTLSLLAESVRRDDDIPAESRRRIELVKQEVVRALDMITDYLAGEDPRPAAIGSDRLDIRDLAGQSAKLAELAYGARVELLPGRPVIVRIRPAVAWRVLSNLVDNAARSAGPGGRVQVSVRQEIDTNGGYGGSSPRASNGGYGGSPSRASNGGYGGSPPRANTVIEVLDDGQGIGRAPGGMAGMGLSVVRQLVDAAEGRLEVSDRADGGTRARVVFCPQRECAIMPGHAGPWH
jgi:signal transduction histidine kinase